MRKQRSLTGASGGRLPMVQRIPATLTKMASGTGRGL